MSAVPRFVEARIADAGDEIAVVLLGAGVVGGAFLRLLPSLRAGIRLAGVANSSRQIADADGLIAEAAPALLSQATAGRDDEVLLAALDESGAARRVVVDATASAATATRHAEWLARGYAVVTANKIAAADSSHAWSALRRECDESEIGRAHV